MTDSPATAPPTVASLSARTTPVDFSSDIERRHAIVEATIRVFRTHAFHEASFDHVAAEAGMHVEGVKAAFPDWNGLILTTIDRWNAERMAPIMPVLEKHGTVVFLREIVKANIADPALMRTLAAVVNIAATPGHPMAPLLHQDWYHFQRLVMGGLSRDVEIAREPSTMEPARGAEQLIALYEGLQLQSMVRPKMDLLDSYDRAVTRLRWGWSHTYTPPVWELSD